MFSTTNSSSLYFTVTDINQSNQHSHHNMPQSSTNSYGPVSQDPPPSENHIPTILADGNTTSSNTNRAKQDARPYDNKIFIYMFINHISGVSTIDQTFNAKFYFRATWVQKKSIHFKNNSSISIQDDKWPDDVYKPDLVFSNAIDYIELCKETLSVSTWRKVDEKEVKVDCIDDYDVIEWKAHAFGTFTSPFEMKNYPQDIQLLQIKMEGLGGAHFHDDRDEENKVVSVLKKDTFTSNTFRLYKEGSTRAWLQDELQRQNSRDSNVSARTKKASSQFLQLTTKEEVVQTYSGREFNVLSFNVPIKRFTRRHTFNVILNFLIASSSFASFLFPPDQISKRLSVSITIGLVMAANYSQDSENLPNMEQTNVFTMYIFLSFFMVFAVVILTSLLALRACDHEYCDELGEEIPDSKLDVAIASILIILWLSFNAVLLYKLYYDFPKRARQRLADYSSGERVNRSSVKAPFSLKRTRSLFKNKTASKLSLGSTFYVEEVEKEV